MKSAIEQMKNLIPNLPTKDIELGFQFLETRDFESLKELVSSAIIKVRRNLRKSVIKEEYLKIDLESLNKLKLIVDEYYAQFESPSLEEEDELDDILMDNCNWDNEYEF